MEKFSLDISREEELPGTVEAFRFCTKSHKGFKEKDAVKNACDGAKRHWNLLKPVIVFISFFETVLFIWLKPLAPGVHSLYPQYHLIYQ